MRSFGRWTTPDPENAGVDRDEPQSWNAYAYVNDNPTNMIDPSGLFPWGVFGGGWGGGFGGIWTERPPIYTGAPLDPRLIIQNFTNRGNRLDNRLRYQLNWLSAFLRDLLSLKSAKQAQKDAWNKGYYACLASKNAGSVFAPAFTHAAGEMATHAAEHNASNLAGAYYHIKDGRFTAWGKSSKVLVPKAASTVKGWAQRANVVGWAVFDAELAHSIYECSEKLHE